MEISTWEKISLGVASFMLFEILFIVLITTAIALFSGNLILQSLAGLFIGASCSRFIIEEIIEKIPKLKHFFLIGEYHYNLKTRQWEKRE